MIPRMPPPRMDRTFRMLPPVFRQHTPWGQVVGRWAKHKRTPEQVFAEFEDVDPRSVLGSGDVKYHMGATGEYVTKSGKKIHIHLASNPSHLEAVDPVTVGRTRAKQDRAGEGGKAKYLPLLVHGDAAFAGQGITAETMNFADLSGYTVGGSLPII